MTPGKSKIKEAKWRHNLSTSSGERSTARPTSFVNWVAISDDASRIIADTYYYPYPGTTSSDTHGKFGAYCYDYKGERIWADEFEGDEGIFSVAISGDGKVAAAGGLFSGGAYADRPESALLRAYDATDGARLLDYMSGRRRINYISLSGDGSVLAAVSANKLFVFLRDKGKFPHDPDISVSAGKFLDCVAVHPKGNWLVACDRGGNVYLVTIRGGDVQKTYTWSAPVVIPFLSVAVSKDAETFVVGGGNVVYLFTKGSMTQPKPDPIATFTPNNTAVNGERSNVRWVAISGDGSFVTSVENNALAGVLRALSYSDNKLTQKWEKALDRNPNSTSMDSAGKYITVADGNPVGTAGSFYLFNAAGDRIWDFGTDNMNWPMFISADGGGIAAGSDDGSVLGFEP